MSKIILILSFLLICSESIAQKKNVFEFPMEESSLLWKISGNGMEHDAYLFGTIHVIPVDDYFFPDTLLSINQSVDLVMLEINLSDGMGDAIELLKLEKGSFFDFFTPEQKDSILDWSMRELAMNPQQFEMAFGKMKPFVVATLAMTSGSDVQVVSYDMNITDQAKEANVEISGLETYKEQLTLFDEGSREEQAEMMMSSIRDLDENESMKEGITAIYLRQNVDSLYLFSTAEGSFEMDPKVFLDNRNKRWVPKIIKAFAENDVLIAVGAGHLGGPKGVIRLLQKKGYTLTPIKL